MVAINCDMGEAYSIYKCGDDEGIMPYITVANVACGYHAADPVVMRRTVELAKRHSVKVGAHPSFPDRDGFGRREMKLTREEITAAVLYQVGALRAFLDAQDMPLNHIKPHGALYGLTLRDEAVAEAITEAVLSAAPDVQVVLLAGPTAERLAERGFPVVREAFADLDYDDAGHIIIEPDPQAKDPQRCADQAVAVLEGEVTSVNGKPIEVDADTVCLHGDRPNAVEVATAVRERFAAEGVRVAPMADVVRKHRG